MEKTLDTKRLKELCGAIIRDIDLDNDVPIGLDWGWANLTNRSLPDLEKFLSEQSQGVDWVKLRDEYFNECVLTNRLHSSVCVAPHDLFEWFKRKLTCNK
ncbi:MAG: hypothetical protein IMZ53_01190 [Thermoplasmata archaeon]|nr:hypothetical protein [Thermoplasmata archaeon]